MVQHIKEASPTALVEVGVLDLADLASIAAQAYISELQQQGIPIAGFSSYKEQQVYEQILGTLFLALDRSKNLLPSNFAAANATYVEQCRQTAQPDLFLGGNDEQRAVQDLVRLHYVAYSRAQMLLLLLVDEHLKDSTSALGLGTDAKWFRQQVEVWPDKER